MIGSLRISLGALRRNAETLRALVAPSRAAFVVKGNAYGHGLVECALAAEPFAAKLCVYSLEEAVALRDGGVTKPVLILGPIEPEHLPDAVAANAEITLWDVKDYARRLAVAAQKRHARVKVHIKLNTGLNRLGLEPEDLPDALEDYVRIAGIEIAGVFSHLASAEEIDSPYTMQQLERFNRALIQAQPILTAHGITPVRHIAASAAAMLWPQTRLDMSRFGIALYGLMPSPQTRAAMDTEKLPLDPALSYETALTVVRTVAAGAPVGYGTTFHAPRDMRIGIIPLGYSDGIPRALSNRGEAVVDGARCPMIGRIAMNMSILDLTSAPGARAGSPVALLGRQGDATVTADDWAQWADTINYEIVTRIPATLKRTYSED
ncbi:MAG: alanine racemase [Candidatus Aquilonibacter sp.]